MKPRDRLRIDEWKRARSDFKRQCVEEMSNSRIDSCMQSQQILQSFSGKPKEPEADGAKSFRIARKQSQTVVSDERRDRSRSSNETSQYSDNGRNSYDRRHPRLDRSYGRNSPNSCNSRDGCSQDSRRPRVEHSPSGISFDRRRDRVNRSHDRQSRVDSPLRLQHRKDLISRKTESLLEKSLLIKSSKFQLGRSRRKRRKLNLEDQKRYNKTKPIKALVFDKAHLDRKISPENVAILTEKFIQRLEEKILSPATLVPRFLGHSHQDGLLTIMCANYFSSEFLRQQIATMPPLWPGADLECIYRPYDEFIIIVVVPEPICHFSEFISLCKKSNNNLCIEKWRRISSEKQADGLGKLYMIGMDLDSYEMIEAKNNKLRCGDNDLEVFLLR